MSPWNVTLELIALTGWLGISTRGVILKATREFTWLNKTKLIEPNHLTVLGYP